MSKLNKFLLEHDFKTISFMHNNSIETDEFIICGTRGWKCPGDDEFGAEDQKIYDRELNRLELSLKSALGLSDGKVLWWPCTIHLLIRRVSRRVLWK